jgi:hypothetical protein
MRYVPKILINALLISAALLASTWSNSVVALVKSSDWTPMDGLVQGRVINVTIESNFGRDQNCFSERPPQQMLQSLQSIAEPSSKPSHPCSCSPNTLTVFPVTVLAPLGQNQPSTIALIHTQTNAKTDSTPESIERPPMV